MAMPSVTVYGPPTAPSVSRVLACLYEKEIKFDLINIDMSKREHRSPDFLKMQVMRAETRTICRYVMEKYPDRGNKVLNGRDQFEKTLINQWVEVEAEKLNPLTTQLSGLQQRLKNQPGTSPTTKVLQRSKSLERQDQETIWMITKSLDGVLNVYEERLKMCPYLAGDEFTFADLSHLPTAQFLVDAPSDRAKLITSRKNVWRWWAAISSRDSWKKVEVGGDSSVGSRPGIADFGLGIGIDSPTSQSRPENGAINECCEGRRQPGIRLRQPKRKAQQSTFGINVRKQESKSAPKRGGSKRRRDHKKNVKHGTVRRRQRHQKKSRDVGGFCTFLRC
ncbi:hypothetical protein RJ639_028623 [Escallonia herrerae]|uniref:glutathione transferase n=1 Tax=Escallonia herrerae TaxID=1293975 RepID=A0AA88X2V9_9ASTE|nr:hypothetical protein RJ639_028623 [Escallonia herrerae]